MTIAKIMWLLFIAFPGETDADEPGFSISVFELRSQCEFSGTKINAELETLGNGGKVMRNEDGTFCKPTTVTQEKRK